MWAAAAQAQEFVTVAIAWVGLFSAGAAFGAAIGVVAGHQLIWAIAGIFAAPFVIILLANTVF